jgi:hypothetical protein
MDINTNVQPIKGRDVIKNLQKRIIQAIIVIPYFVLPLVSGRIFDAVKCRAFNIDNQEPPISSSYRLMDLTVECSRNEDDTYRSIIAIF